jgi:hypothetical protein
MKIYNKLVLDMNTWEVLEEDSFEYDGPLALCGGGSSEPDPVVPTAEEKALQAAQLAAIQRQEAENKALQPFLYQSMGLTTDADGSLRKMTDDEYYNSLSETGKAQYDVTKLQQERLKNAYEGKLPVSTALENDLTDQETALKNTLAAKLGANWQQSTPGIQAMSEFQKKAEELREQARTGEMNTGTALALNQMGFLQTSKAQDSSLFSSIPGRWGNVAQQYGTAQQPYQYYNGLNAQIASQNAQNSNNQSAGLMGGIGSLAGAGMGALGNYMGLSSLAGRGISPLSSAKAMWG